ncbi:MAG: site-specific integrase [Bacteroidetes bacterium]|nr:site-specific integrase [Bacteroidota bacterium]
MKIQFKITRKISGKKSPILLVIFNKMFGKKGVLYYGTGTKILPNYFDTITQRPVKNKGTLKGLDRETLRDFQLIEDKLNQIQAAARILIDQITYNKLKIDSTQFKEKLDQLLHPTEEVNHKSSNSEITIKEYLNQYILDLRNGNRLTEQGNCLKPGSIKNYETFSAQFILFQKRLNRELRFSDISMQLYKEFILFLNHKNYSTNSVGKHIVRFKKLLRDAKLEGLYKGNEHEQKYFKAPEEDIEAVYLTSEELTRIKDLNLSNEPILDLHRDIFLIGCHTAQRISDYKSICPNNIMSTAAGTKILKLKQVKTSCEVQIPIGRELDNILAKYNYKIPPIYDQHLNESLKIICRAAEVLDTITIERTRGGEKNAYCYLNAILSKAILQGEQVLLICT